MARRNNTTFPWQFGQIISIQATSPGSLIQSTYGSFEVVVVEGRNLVHCWHDNSNMDSSWQLSISPLPPASTAAQAAPHTPPPSTPGRSHAQHGLDVRQRWRPLGDIADDAFALVTSLDATQQKAAILGSSPIDLVLGPGQDGKTIQAEGLPAAQMTADQPQSPLQTDFATALDSRLRKRSFVQHDMVL